MKKFLTTSSFHQCTLTSSMSFDADKTITLSVPGMNWPSCRYMLVPSLLRVDCVADREIRSADVTVDEANVSIADILVTTAAAGYQSPVLATGEGL